METKHFLKKIISIAVFMLAGLVLVAVQSISVKKEEQKISDAKITTALSDDYCAQDTLRETKNATNPKPNLFVTCGGFLE